ncbi:MAG: sterol carrier protein [Chloroflexi bacterium]|nr:MAG: sterol carrier protein [Chloroflexota bacterium]RLC82573.1 MAG: sterol carrier protein [Chloroflexota bacterium]HEY72183.1 SCP2 sterol-binding domain-containing protein [Thermoflexia bacterium]
MAVTTVQEVFARMPDLDPSKVQGLDAVIVFELSGEGGGEWTLTVEDGKIKVEEGTADSPSMTLSMDGQDFVAMSNGELNATSAFMQGKIKISGDMSLAMRLQSILT